ncbi:hypothetical protein E3E26_04560 [Thermococcus sp. LS1]|uniref:hypothetical protein n=1 Tax=Thermococcus sp. LS1 TaxID=1638259 RepID=UPI00143B0A10|nr:hypothetical protein [Thermococcus sp. LS1]NJD99059.1 hypothetical protein [Thermococcus sp. LS1]
MTEKEKAKSCGDGWEKLSSTVSSFSLSLLPTMLFILIMSYILVVGLQNAEITFTVQGQEVTVNYPEIPVPIDYSAIRNAVMYLFVAVVMGLPVPLLPEGKKLLKAAIALVQAGIFVYALYIFVSMITQFANALT